MTHPPLDSAGAVHLELLLDGHLVGTLTHAERAEFAAALAADESFARQVTLQERAAAALGRSYVPTARDMRIESARAASAGLRMRWWMAAAAVVAIGAFFGVQWANRDRSNTPGAIYARMVATGFKPDFVCSQDPEYFNQRVSMKLGKGLTPTLPEGSPITFAGWNFDTTFGTPLSSAGMILLAKNGQTPIVVFMDRASADHPQPQPAKGLSVFRSEVNGLVLYEVSPLAEPSVLPLLHGKGG